MSLTTTDAPRSAKAMANARPKPRPAPVTTATWPSKRMGPGELSRLRSSFASLVIRHRGHLVLSPTLSGSPAGGLPRWSVRGQLCLPLRPPEPDDRVHPSIDLVVKELDGAQAKEGQLRAVIGVALVPVLDEGMAVLGERRDPFEMDLSVWLQAS